MEAKPWFCLTCSLTSCVPMHGASLPTVEMTAEAKGESWKELDMYKHHTVALMQLSKQPTKATVALFLSVKNKNKSRFLLGVPQVCKHPKNRGSIPTYFYKYWKLYDTFSNAHK